MSKRLTRAKHKIRDAGIPFAVPPDHLLPERLDAVLAVVYLIFNEGWGGGRVDLSAEAIRLGRSAGRAHARRSRSARAARAHAHQPRAHRRPLPGQRARPARRSGSRRCGTSVRSRKAGNCSNARSPSTGAVRTSSRQQSPISTSGATRLGGDRAPLREARTNHQLAGRDDEPRDRRRRTRRTRSRTRPARLSRARRLPLLPLDTRRPSATPRPRRRGPGAPTHAPSS